MTTDESTEDAGTLKHPGTWARGDMVTYDGSVAHRGPRGWYWSDWGWFARRFYALSDRDFDSFLAGVHPHARIIHLNPDRTDR